MTYLLDSQLLYWLRFGNPRIPESVYTLLEDSSLHIYYSVISPWELSIKNAKGKLPLPPDFFDTLPALGFDCLAIEEKHIHALRALPHLHGDPFDRMLAAQAQADHMTLITSDRQFADYPIKTIMI